jgi:hypothetical protein
MIAIGSREQAPAAIDEASNNRQRAFTLLLTAYSQVRRAITYLRWNEGDADSIAPSLYAARRKKGNVTEDDTIPGMPVLAEPSPAPVASGPKPAIGMPGSDPLEGN